jgi:hypothetical protein
MFASSDVVCYRSRRAEEFRGWGWIDDDARSTIYAGQVPRSGKLFARVDLGTQAERTLCHKR